jgi:adenine-specific DNA-methyltransferase
MIERQLKNILGQPLFCQPGFILYKGDCTEIMRALSGSNIKVDLTLTSPPYNIGKEYETIRGVEEFTGWCSSWMNQIYEMTSDTGTFWLNLGYFNVPSKGLCVPISYLLWDKSPFYLLQEAVWKYGAGVSSKKRFAPRNEKWLYYVKNPEQYIFNLDEIRDPNVKYPNQKKNGKFRCNPLGKNPSDVWEFPKVTTGSSRSSKERTGHPAQFPLGIVERIIRASSHLGDLVFDPFAGSCSTGIGAAALGRIFLGCELSENYCNIAIERYKSFTEKKMILNSQNSLF